MTCTRRPDSLWTKCACTRCRGRNARLVKLNKAGMLRMPDPQAAVERIRGWHAAGFSDEWIASACGINPWQVHRIAGRTRRGLPCTLFHGTTRLILAADIRDGSDGTGPALSLERRVQALAAIGYTQCRIATETGIAQGLLSRIQAGLNKHATARNWHALVDYYDAHCMTPGDSDVARKRAARAGWAPPLAWDDDSIDDPAATPYVGEQIGKQYTSGKPSEHTAEDVADVLSWNGLATVAQVAERLSTSTHALLKALDRAGRDDLRDQLNRNARLAGHPVDEHISTRRRTA